MPYLALIGTALDLLSKGQASADDRRNALTGIRQQQLANKAAVYQGGRANADYSQFSHTAAQQPGNAGLGTAVQLLGAAAGAAGGGDSGTGGGAAYDAAIDHATSAGSYDLDPGILDRGLGASSGENASAIGVPSAVIHLNEGAGYDDSDKWKRGLRL